MVVQAVARKLEDLPFTLLEIHTLAHVICALNMYILWMKKPVDIQDPWVISREATAKLFRLVGVYFLSPLPPASLLTHLSRNLRSCTTSLLASRIST